MQSWPEEHHRLKNIAAEVFREKVLELGDNCIQNLHLGRYIAGYTVANF